MKNDTKVTTNQIMTVLVDMQKNMATKDDLKKSEVKSDHAFSDLYEFLQENMIMRSEFNNLERRFDRLEQNVQIFRMDITDRMDQRFSEMGGKISRLVDTLKDKRVINKSDAQFVLATT